MPNKLACVSLFSLKPNFTVKTILAKQYMRAIFGRMGKLVPQVHHSYGKTGVAFDCSVSLLDLANVRPAVNQAGHTAYLFMASGSQIFVSFSLLDDAPSKNTEKKYSYPFMASESQVFVSFPFLDDALNKNTENTYRPQFYSSISKSL